MAAASHAAIEAARYVARRLPGLAKTTLVKLLFLADCEFARRHGRTLTGASWWKEKAGPLSATVTEALKSDAFDVTEGKSPSGNRRIGVCEARQGPLRTIGGAQLAVLDLILAEYGKLGQVELLKRVYKLPAVARAETKQPIALPKPRATRSSASYVTELLREIEAEERAGIYDWDAPRDPAEEAERAALGAAFASASARDE